MHSFITSYYNALAWLVAFSIDCTDEARSRYRSIQGFYGMDEPYRHYVQTRQSRPVRCLYILYYSRFLLGIRYCPQ